MSSLFLFADFSFGTGFARVVDIAGGFDLYNVSRDPQEADSRAIYADFREVGDLIVEVACDNGVPLDQR